MSFYRLLFSILLLGCLFNTESNALDRDTHFYRNFWNPTFHIQRLNYCTLDGKTCGLDVARCYCRMLGYQDADQQIIDHNVGLTHYINTKARCRGWTCNGFKLIRCVSQMTHIPPKKHHYRSQLFVLPHFEHYRIDWCYKNGQGCGQRAANSFCRRMGFSQSQSFKSQEHVPATKALGNQKRCFGNQCKGFREISCHR